MKTTPITPNEKVDGHIHLFDPNGTIIPANRKCVCFADVNLNKLAEYKPNEILGQYEEFIKTQYDPNKHILLATAAKVDEIIRIKETFPNEIRGFGEIKCYDHTKKKKVDLDDLSYIYPLIIYNNLYHREPLYIHFEVTDEEHCKVLARILDISNFPIVLCHCGVPYDKKNSKLEDATIIKWIQIMQQIHPNLWCDISWSGFDYLYEHKEELESFDKSRVIIGSDINVISEIRNHRPADDIYKKMAEMERVLGISNMDNIERLFSVKNGSKFER